VERRGKKKKKGREKKADLNLGAGSMTIDEAAGLGLGMPKKGVWNKRVGIGAKLVSAGVVEE